MLCILSIQITRLVATDIDTDESNRVPITYAITSITPTADIIIDCKYFNLVPCNTLCYHINYAVNIFIP